MTPAMEVNEGNEPIQHGLCRILYISTYPKTSKTRRNNKWLNKIERIKELSPVFYMDTFSLVTTFRHCIFILC